MTQNAVIPVAFVDISIHTLHTEGDFLRINLETDERISIHTLHTEGDGETIENPYKAKIFQSTPSTRRVTGGNTEYVCVPSISIHTLHTEGDQMPQNL